MMKREIPEAVLDRAKDILDMEGGFVKWIGEKDGRNVYYSAVKGAETGFPTLFLWDGRNVEEIDGIEALVTSRLFLK